jgi:hypothetical protein
VSPALENIEPKYQVSPTTHGFAKWLGEQTDTSPILIDHVYKGYTGAMGMYAADLLDSYLNVYSDVPKASMRFEQMPVIRRFLADPEARGNVSAYYDLKHSVDTVVRTVNKLEKEGNPEVAEYATKNAKLYAARDFLSGLNKQMQDLQDQANMVQSARIPADEKRDILEKIRKAQNLLTNDIQAVRKIVQP